MINAILSLFSGATNTPQETAPATGFDAALRALIPGLPSGESEASPEDGRRATSPEAAGISGSLGVGSQLMISVGGTAADGAGDSEGAGNGESRTGTPRPGTESRATSPGSATTVEGDLPATPTLAREAGSTGSVGSSDGQPSAPVADTPGTVADGPASAAPGQAGATGEDPHHEGGATEGDRPEAGHLEAGDPAGGVPAPDRAGASGATDATDRSGPMSPAADPADPAARSEGPAAAPSSEGSRAAKRTRADGGSRAVVAEERNAARTPGPGRPVSGEAEPPPASARRSMGPLTGSPSTAPHAPAHAGPAGEVWTASAVVDVEVSGGRGNGIDDRAARTRGAVAGSEPAVAGESDARWARAAASTLDRMRTDSGRAAGAETSANRSDPEGQATHTRREIDAVARDLQTAQREVRAHERSSRAPTGDSAKGDEGAMAGIRRRRPQGGGSRGGTDRPAVEQASSQGPVGPTATAAGNGTGSGYDAGSIRMAEPVQGPDTAGRVESIDALREQEARQPLKRVSVRVGEGESATRVRVSVRGDAVQAEMATESERLANRIGRELPELKQSIQRQGLEPDALRVRHGERMVAGEVAAPRSGGSARSGGGGQEQQQSSHRSGSHHDAHEGRDRSRDHHNEEGNE